MTVLPLAAIIWRFSIKKMASILMVATACASVGVIMMLVQEGLRLKTVSKLTASVDQANSSFCTPQQLAKGTWVKNITDRAPYSVAQQFGNLLVSKCYNVTDVFSVTPWISYEWVPNDDCVFRAWDPDLFCSRFANQTISFLGDSLSWEMFCALGYSLGTAYLDEHLIGRPAIASKTDVIIDVCHNTTRLTFRRDDYLQQIPTILQEQNPNILVLNRGAHYVDDVRLEQGIRENIAQLEAHQRNLTFRNDKFQVVLRLTVPGHPLCKQFQEPSSSLEDMWSLINNKSLYTKDFHPKAPTFRWWEFQKQNSLILDLYRREISNVSYQVLDAVIPLVLRPDLHSDCLHSCLPGRIDLYHRMFLHQLTSTSTAAS
uniref:Uncharacterized protein n=1 Tax=Grammatophora oceanica TaxID=210454 RepID=A0A7S1URL3_9STRA|mmetsp:Transcript_1932/g.2580  ORF Transcript_1932/g.2580 Transcript_1932/m.2580 type:complete len:372 (+) Transcript_1932:55-1170(+)|eukprot:CAMPEP_0194040828 /NCGR_PEP_ID=MMETSP0009_2-20130614/12772_1 /TAXON_ID=210454 /ORGANISM="Grammatophora oceanica, Strain CCMP 410" /LENGTH=371 /DNA_ID=CAMNT_0038684097 /DNA_START=49 /DNA_END=1164 /DNA_ORIENTATION=+